MRKFRFILALAVFLVVGCNRGKESDDREESSLDSHEEAVAKFQDGQMRFKNLIATVRDEASFDAAKDGLDEVVSDWRYLAIEFKELKPPSEDEQARFRELIAEGHRRSEPTGGDFMNLFSIESRETEITQWFEEFAEAAGEAGDEMARLYGSTDDAKAVELGLNGATFTVEPIVPVPKDPAVPSQQDQGAEQVGDDEPAAGRDSKAE